LVAHAIYLPGCATFTSSLGSSDVFAIDSYFNFLLLLSPLARVREIQQGKAGRKTSILAFSERYGCGRAERAAHIMALEHPICRAWGGPPNACGEKTPFLHKGWGRSSIRQESPPRRVGVVYLLNCLIFFA